MNALDILRTKPKQLFSVLESQKISDVVELLASHKIGFVIVNDDSGAMVGVLSERDIVHKCLYRHMDMSSLVVREIMTGRSSVIVGTENENIQSIMNIMTERRFRHLPIEKEGEIIGVISIGDVVKNLLEEKEKEIKNLSDYVSGNYPG